MSRLYDRMLEGFRPPNNVPNPDSLVSTERWLLERAEVIAFDNVNDFYWANLKEHGRRRFFASLCPNVAPPFPYFFLETRAPSSVGLPDGPSPWLRSGPKAWGVLCWAQDLTAEPLFVYDTPQDREWAERVQQMLPAPRWVVEASVYLEHRKGDPVGPCMMHRFPVLPDGTLPESAKFQIRRVFGRGAVPEEKVRRIADEYLLYVEPALLTVSFMHCKNVEVQAVEPPQKLSKKHDKHHGRPLVRYHVLGIEPMKRILRKEGQIDLQGLRKALHICRGHFKDYRGGGLFRRHKGIFWWADQLRGNPREGIAFKDYDVKPVREDPTD